MEDVLNPFQKNPNYRKILTVIGVFVAIFIDLTMVIGNSILLPVAAQEIGGADIYSLAGTISGALTVVLIPLFGFLAAKRPQFRRNGFIMGLVICAASLVVRATATNMMTVVIAAVLTAFSSSAEYTFGYAMIRDSFNTKKAGTLLGTTATIVATGLLIGPLLTSAVVQMAGWRVMPIIQLVVFLIAAVLVLFGVRITKEEGKSMSVGGSKVDIFGVISVGMLMAGLLLALTLGISAYAPFGSALSFVFIAVAVLGLVLLLVDVNKKKDEAVIPRSVFKDNNAVACAISTFLGNFDAMALNFFLPAFIMVVMQKTPVEAGLAISVYAIPGLFLGPIFGRWIARIGTARPLVMFFSGAWRTVVVLVMFFLVMPGVDLAVIYVTMFLGGVYSAASGVIGSTSAQIMIKPERRQQANALVQLMQSIGGGVGIALFASVIGIFGMVDGFHWALLITVIGSALVIISGARMKKPDWDQGLEPSLKAVKAKKDS